MNLLKSIRKPAIVEEIRVCNLEQKIMSGSNETRLHQSQILCEESDPTKLIVNSDNKDEVKLCRYFTFYFLLN